jgi:hypothetical protein
MTEHAEADVRDDQACLPLAWEWEYHPNPACATIHINRRFPKFSAGGSFFSDLGPPIPESWADSVRAVMAIPGVEEIWSGSFGSYHSLTVMKGRMFPWGPIRERVQEILCRQFGDRPVAVNGGDGGVETPQGPAADT